MQSDGADTAAGLQSIGASAFSSAFADAGVDTVIIPNSVTSIGNSAFSGCSFLSNLTLPASSLTSIGAGVFNGTALPSVTIPASVTSIGVNPFVGGALRTIHAADGNSKYKAVNNMLVECKDSELYKVISCPCNAGEKAEVPAQVKIIGDSAFQSSKVKNVKVSGAVNKIEQSAFDQSELETYF